MTGSGDWHIGISVNADRSVGSAFQAGRFDVERVRAALIEVGRPDLAESCTPVVDEHGEVIGMAYAVALPPDDLYVVDKAIAVSHRLER